MRRYEMAGCPVCGETAAATVADTAQVRAEVEELWAFHTRRLRGDTPPAQLHDRVAFSQSPALRIARCVRCALLYRNPRERAETLVELYSSETPDPRALATIFDNQLPVARAQAQRLARFVSTVNAGLEVGSYAGTFLCAARELGWHFGGVDVNDVANEFARSRGLQIFSGTIDDVEGTYDVVAFWNCFDQMPDPLAAAARARALMSAGGWLVLRVPNGAFYAAWRSRLHTRSRRMARAVLAHNNLLAFPYRHGFTTRSLEVLLDRSGFELKHVAGDTLAPVADRWTRPWARLEERMIKSVLRRLPAARSPWLEVYAQAR